MVRFYYFLAQGNSWNLGFETLNEWKFDKIGRIVPGELLTWASWMRKFVQDHPEYKQDSVVTEKMTYDLMWRYTRIVTGQLEDDSILFKLKNSSQSDVSKAQTVAQDRLEGCDCNDD